MSDASTTTTTATPVPATNSINTFFANLKSDLMVVEEDVISAIQNIGAGIEVAAEDLTYCLSWLGSHIGQIAATVTAVQNSANALTAAGIVIPPSLVNGITAIEQATAGVTAALNNQTVDGNASKALTDGYSATKALQVAAGSAAAIAATIQASTTPAAT